MSFTKVFWKTESTKFLYLCIIHTFHHCSTCCAVHTHIIYSALFFKCIPLFKCTTKYISVYIRYFIPFHQCFLICFALSCSINSCILALSCSINSCILASSYVIGVFILRLRSKCCG